MTNPSSFPHFFPVRHAVFRHLELLAGSAAFLFNKVVLHSTGLLRGFEYLQPWAIALTESDGISARLSGAPVLAVNTPNAAGVGVDPGNRVLSGLHTGADVEL